MFYFFKELHYGQHSFIYVYPPLKLGGGGAAFSRLLIVLCAVVFTLGTAPGSGQTICPPDEGCGAWSTAELYTTFTLPIAPLCTLKAFYRYRICNGVTQVEILRYEYPGPIAPPECSALKSWFQAYPLISQKELWLASMSAAMRNLFAQRYAALPDNLKFLLECPNGTQTFHGYVVNCMKQCAYNDPYNNVMRIQFARCGGYRCCRLVSVICYNTSTQTMEVTQTVEQVGATDGCDNDPKYECETSINVNTPTGQQTIYLDFDLVFPCFSPLCD